MPGVDLTRVAAAVALEREGAEPIRDTPCARVVRVRLEGCGRVLHVLWARFPGGSLAVFPAEGEKAVVFDQWGREITVLVPQGGQYEVGLQPAQCTQNPCVIGGPVLYVVEESG